MHNPMQIISVVIFVLISGASIGVNIYLLKYPRDNVFNLVLKPILYFVAIFFLTTIPVLLGVSPVYLFSVIPLVFLLSVVIGLGSYVFTKVVEGIIKIKSKKD